MALLMFIVFMLVVVISRVIYQYTLIQDHGIRTPRMQLSSIATITSALLLVAFGGIFVLSLLDWRALSNPIETMVAGRTSIGIVVCLAGVSLISYSQYEMGANWRIGVDENETTELVITGIYRIVRNPIYTGVAVFLFGMIMLLPQVTTVCLVLLGLLSIHLHVRYIEEPHLRKLHGERFTRYCESAGAYWPKLFRASSKS